jgi:nicotinate phosphoribosyltransferase
MLAKEFGITPIGTMAHEWLQAHQALGYRISDSQKAAFENWAKEYRGDLGIALSDVIGLDAFLLDFDMYFAKLFDGVRQDSGDPDTFAMKMIQHYEKMRIDPKTKTIVFSDGLDLRKAVELWQRYRDKIRISFGIGTHLTNDFGFKPLQIVLKMVECNDQPVAKLSDSPEKGMCNDKGYVEYITKVFSEKIRKAAEKRN